MGCGFQDVAYIVSFRLTWATVRSCLKITKATIKREVEKFIKFPEPSKDNKIMISCTPTQLSRCLISWRQKNGLLFIKLYGTQLICSFFICSRCLQSQIPRSFLLSSLFVPTLIYRPSENCLPVTEKLTVFPLRSSASGQLGNKSTLNSHSRSSVNRFFNKGLPQQAPALQRRSAFLRRARRTTRVLLLVMALIIAFPSCLHIPLHTFQNFLDKSLHLIRNSSGDSFCLLLWKTHPNRSFSN